VNSTTQMVEWAWLALSLGALAAAAWQGHRTGWRGVELVGLLVGFVVVWAVLQYASFFAALLLGGYCENCSGRPFTRQDAVAYAVISTPTALAWLVVAMWRAATRKS
jgi:hypothetical protein